MAVNVTEDKGVDFIVAPEWGDDECNKECENDKDVLFSDGCFLLLPGEEKEILLEYSTEMPGKLFVSGFGVPYQELKF